MVKIEDIKEIQILKVSKFGGKEYAQVAIAYKDLTGEITYLNVEAIRKLAKAFKDWILEVTTEVIGRLAETGDFIPTS